MSVNGPAFWTVPGSPHFYEMHGHGSFPSKTDGNLHSQLPRRLARSRPVRGGIVVTQIPPSQPVIVPRTQGQLSQERTVSQPMNIVPGNSFRLCPNEGCGHTRACSGHTAARSLFRDRSLSPTQIVSDNAGHHGLRVPSATTGPVSYAAPSALAETEGSIRCQEDSVVASNYVNLRILWQSGRLYSQMPRPFWWALVRFIRHRAITTSADLEVICYTSRLILTV